MVNGEMSALVIIDAQWDFLSPNGPYARRHAGIQGMLAAQSRLQKLLDKEPLPVIAILSQYRPNQFGEGLSLCLADTTGAECSLRLPEDAKVFHKGEHSAFSCAPFREYLADASIKTLYIAGFLIEYCVRATAIDSVDMGLETVVLADLVDTADDVQGRKEATFGEFRDLGVRVEAKF